MEALREDLTRYPSSFSITEHVKTLSERNLAQIKDKLLLELCSISNELSTSMEKIRVLNLLSYLYFVLGDRKNANKYNREVFEVSPNNAIALANRAWFAFKDRKYLTICADSLKKLKTLKSDSMTNLMAKAELAFTYSRFGLNLYHLAIPLFKDVMDEVNTIIEHQSCDDRTPSTDVKCASSTVDECASSTDGECASSDVGKTQDALIELKCVWIYGYALTLKRLLHIANTKIEQESVEGIRNRHKSVFELFEKIVNLDGNSECLLRYKARSLVEAGILAFGVNRNRSLFPRGMEGMLPKDSVISMPIYKCFEDALKLFSTDYFVLERCGRYFRYIDDLPRSISVLNTAVSRKGTSFGYHHLALSYIRLLEYNPSKLKYCLDSGSKASKQCVTQISPFMKNDVSAQMSNLAINVNGAVSKQTKEADYQIVQSCESYPVSDKIKDIKFQADNTSVHPDTSASNSVRIMQTSPKSTKHSKLNPMANIFLPRAGLKDAECCVSKNTDDSYSQMNLEVYDPPTFCVPVIRDRPQSNSNYSGIVCKQRSKYRDERMPRTTQGQFAWNSGTHQKIFQSKSDVRNMSQFQKPHTRGKSLDFVVKCLRFPRKISYEKYKDVADTIICHLDASVKISPNMAALYDKAVFYRQINESWKALEVLEYLMQNNENLCSAVLLANAYEQAAFCISDILDSGEKIDDERKRQLTNDRQIYLKSSIEVACSIIDKFPYLGHCWRSAVTLRDILLCNTDVKRTRDTLKDLWFLYQKMKNNEGVIDVLTELKELTEDEADKREICEEIVKKYLCVQKYEEAVIALSMLMPLDDKRSCFNQTLYSQVYVESGLYAFQKRNFDKARLLIGKAFGKLTGDEEVKSTMDRADERYDIFILSNLDDEEQGKNLMLLLNNLGLNTTFNSESMSIIPGTPEIEGLTKVMSISKAYVILVNWDIGNITMQHLMDRMRVIVESRQETNPIFTVANKEVHLPSTCGIAAYKRFNLDMETITESEIGSKDNNVELMKLLMELTYAYDENKYLLKK